MKQHVLAQIQAVFGRECLPINLPDQGASTVVDCFYNRDGHSDNHADNMGVEGPSDDPGFVIEIRGDERIYDVGGSTVFVSAEGHFYTSARMNQDYQKRQKYRLSTEGLTEVTQAYYLVDSQCAVTELTQLYSLPCGKGHVVASIPQGGRVQVMLHDANAACAIPQYLVSSSFGLVGWVGSESGLLNIEPGKPLNCISFYGD